MNRTAAFIVAATLLAACGSSAPTPAKAQCTGVFPSGTLCGNATTSSAPPKVNIAGALHSKDYGALGNNSADDTTALQNWINACQSLRLVCLLDAGNYKVTSTLNITAGITITGVGARISVLNPTQTATDIIAVNTTSSFFFSNFRIVAPSSGGLPTSTNGALISVTAPGSGINAVSRFTNLDLNFGFIGINLIQADQIRIDNINMQGTASVGVQMANAPSPDAGDNVIANSTIQCNPGTGTGILQVSAGGTKLTGNKIQVCTIGYSLVLATGVTTSEVTITGNNFENTTDISLAKGTGTAFGNIVIAGNYLTVGTNGNGFGVTDDANPGWLNGVSIIGNLFNLTNSSSTAIALANTTNLNVTGNLIQGNGGTPTGITIAAGATNGIVNSNVIRNMTTPLTASSASVRVTNNSGYNPVGTSAATTVGASPATITAGPSPETHYLNQSATNSATVAKGTHQIHQLTNATTWYVVDLGPFESYVVTWVTTQPTVVKDIH